MCRADVFADSLVENVDQIFIKIQSTREAIINESIYDYVSALKHECLLV